MARHLAILAALFCSVGCAAFNSEQRNTQVQSISIYTEKNLSGDGQDAIRGDGFVIDEKDKTISFDDNIGRFIDCSTVQINCLASSLFTLIIFKNANTAEIDHLGLHYVRTRVADRSPVEQIEKYKIFRAGTVVLEYSFSLERGIFEICPHLERFPGCLGAISDGVFKRKE